MRDRESGCRGAGHRGHGSPIRRWRFSTALVITQIRDIRRCGGSQAPCRTGPLRDRFGGRGDGRAALWHPITARAGAIALPNVAARVWKAATGRFCFVYHNVCLVPTSLAGTVLVEDNNKGEFHV
ncbi:hypothetical protein G6F40_016338 [Rhizopus arrhizus]|nr:hypothetical protein G6F40_016338 [Rhizopus arrhizus]